VKPCLLIPILDHGSTIRGVVDALAPLRLPLVIVNDGSGPETCRVLDTLAKELDWVEIRHHAVNRGKGVALRTGYRALADNGFSHVLQLDADGQHDPRDVPRFLAAARAQPDAQILGQPIFGPEAPKTRLYGRKLSVGMVAVATLSREVRDPLCGYRCLPLAPILELIDHLAMGDRMDFEPELAVRLCWMGVPCVNLPTRVRYLPGGLSHFDVVWDDLRLTWLYTRLTLGMFARAPRLVAERAARRAPA
jgi:glycosyltransferase involved in cell wall biosynthesis